MLKEKTAKLLIQALFFLLTASAIRINKFVSKAKKFIFPEIDWLNVLYLYKFSDLENRALNSFLWKSFKYRLKKVHFEGMYSVHLDVFTKFKQSFLDIFLSLVTEEVVFSKFDIGMKTFVKVIESSRNCK